MIGIIESKEILRRAPLAQDFGWRVKPWGGRVPFRTIFLVASRQTAELASSGLDSDATCRSGLSARVGLALLLPIYPRDPSTRSVC